MKIIFKNIYLKKTLIFLFENKFANLIIKINTLLSNFLILFLIKFFKRKKIFCVIKNSLFILKRKLILTLFKSY